MERKVNKMSKPSQRKELYELIAVISHGAKEQFSFNILDLPVTPA